MELFLERRFQLCVTGRRDIALVIDESASVMSHNYAKQLVFLQNVASKFSIGKQGTQFGAVAFNTNARLAFTLDQYLTKHSLLAAIGSVSYIPGGTSIGAGIEFARQHLFTAANGDRSDVDDYMIVITDGFSADTVTSGIAARNAGITLFAVAVDGYDINDLIAATGDVSKVFTAPNYDSLNTIVDLLANAFPCDYSSPTFDLE
ncbi:vitrin-like [Pecten maximus]|uniref:vitrin-like n=1 Tax=Pecten maximus TaxID=6579 RepID=UPI001458F016|nr:vitrin-like [Pecten maximus]